MFCIKLLFPTNSLFTVTGTNGHRFRIVMVTSYMTLSFEMKSTSTFLSMAARSAQTADDTAMQLEVLQVCDVHTSVKLQKTIYNVKETKKLNGSINVILGRTE